jgi:sugar phosphate isomerase/epimerase
LTVADLITRAGQQGVSIVQVGDNLPLHALTEQELAACKTLADRSQVRLEVGARRLTPEHLHAYLDIARQFGSPFVRFVIDDDDYKPSVDEVVGIIRESLVEIRRHNVRLAIENHDRFPARFLKRIVQATDPHWVGICLDTTNSLGAGEDTDTVADTLAPYTFNLHIKDFTVRRMSHKMGFNVEGAPAGQGLLSVPRLLQKMIPYNRCYSATLELWTPPEADVAATIRKEAAWAEESLAYLQPFFVKHFPVDVAETRGM